MLSKRATSYEKTPDVTCLRESKLLGMKFVGRSVGSISCVGVCRAGFGEGHENTPQQGTGGAKGIYDTIRSVGRSWHWGEVR